MYFSSVSDFYLCVFACSLIIALVLNFIIFIIKILITLNSDETYYWIPPKKNKKQSKRGK